LLQHSSTAWVLVCYVLAVAISLIVIDLRYAFFATAVAICAFVMLGFLVFPVFSSEFTFHLDAIDESNLPKEVSQGFRFLGKTLHPRWFSQEIRCAMRLRNMPLLLAALVLAIIVIVAIWREVSLSFLIAGENRMWNIMAIVFVGALLLGWSWIWLAEQLFLRNSAAALGIVQTYVDENQARVVRYEFHDSEGERRGGIEQDFMGNEEDHAVVVLYHLKNPDHCLSSRGFMFHQFMVVEDPGNEQ
jgi:hypothetical protein